MNTPRLIKIDTGEAFLLERAETIVGRSDDCLLVVRAESVSSRHAAITRDSAGQVTIRDLGSSNGTFVNGVRVGEAHLAEGNSVSIAGVKFIFHAHEAVPLPLPIVAAESKSTDRQEPSQLESKAIWHPVGITLAGIFPLGFVFASVLIALNWHRLQRHGMAVFAYCFAIIYVVGVQYPLLPMFAWPWPYVVGVLVWFPILGLPQWQFIRRQIPKPYPKRPWLRILSIGFAIQVTLAIWARSDQAAPPVVSSTSSSTDTESEYTAESLTEIVQKFVVEVRATWKERQYWFFQSDNGKSGSAVLFKSVSGEYFFVTNRHVVEPPQDASAYQCTIRVDGQGYVPVEVLAFGKNGVDLALFRVVVPGAKDAFTIPMTPLQAVHPGQQCIALGNALGGGISVTSGIVSRFDPLGSATLIRTSAPISPGNSGGGLFLLKGGSLIGITTRSMVDGQNINQAIPIDYVLAEDSWDYLPGKSR